MKKLALTVASLTLAFAPVLFAAPRGPVSSAQQQKKAAAVQNQQDPQVKTFTGTIEKSGDQFVLKIGMGKTSYHLDDQETASKFDGKRVKVTGVLNADANTIRVQSIEEATA